MEVIGKHAYDQNFAIPKLKIENYKIYGKVNLENITINGTFSLKGTKFFEPVRLSRIKFTKDIWNFFFGHNFLCIIIWS